jgi:hypothetical protein
MRTHTRCDIGPSLQPGLLYTHPDLTIIPTTDGLTTWRVVLVQDGRWEFEVDAVASATPHTSRGSIYTVEEPSCRGRPEDAFNYKYKGGNRGLVSWLEEW